GRDHGEADEVQDPKRDHRGPPLRPCLGSSATAPAHIGTPVRYAARARACDAAGFTTSKRKATSAARDPYVVSGPCPTTIARSTGSAPMVMVFDEHWMRQYTSGIRR